MSKSSQHHIIPSHIGPTCNVSIIIITDFTVSSSYMQTQMAYSRHRAHKYNAYLFYSLLLHNTSTCMKKIELSTNSMVVLRKCYTKSLYYLVGATQYRHSTGRECSIAMMENANIVFRFLTCFLNSLTLLCASTKR